MINANNHKGLAETYRALSDETRLQILGVILHRGELCVCDVVHVLDITQSKASRHLRYLLKTGFLKDRRDGVWSYYRIPEDVRAQHLAILNLLQTQLTEQDLAPLLERLAAWRKTPHCNSAFNPDQP